MNAATVPTVSKEAEFIDAFLKGTITTFKIQCSYEVTPEKSRLLTPNEQIPTDICGLIGLTSSVFCGAITLCFPEKFFLGAMSGMFGEPCTSVTDELSDGAGELLNIIFGQAKTILTNKGIAVQKAIPTVIRGKEIKLSTLTGGSPTIAVPFRGADGLLHVLISLSNKVDEPLKVVKR